MSREGDRVRRAAAELSSDMGMIRLPDGTYTTGGRCAEQALRRHGASVSRATRSFGERPFRAYNRAGGDPTDLVRRLYRHADELDLEEVTPQKPKEEPKPKNVRTPRPKATQRPGGRARPIRKPAPPRVSAPRPARPAGRPWTPAIAGAIAVLFTVSLAARHGAAIATTVGTTLGILAILGLVIVVGGAVGVAAAEGLDWSTVRPWWERRQHARAAVKARRTELVQEATSAIVLGPATPAATPAVAPATTPVEVPVEVPVPHLDPAPPAVDPLVAKWTDPARAVPDYVHLYQARTGRKARR